MASSEKRSSYSLAQVIGVTVLTGLFVTFGTYLLVDLLVRILPSTEIEVQIVDRSSGESGGYIGRGTFSRRLTHYVTVQEKNGKKRTIPCPKKLYDRALPGLSELMKVQLTISYFFDRPVTMSVDSSAGSLIKQGSALDKLIHAGGESSRSKKEAEQYSLLIPLVGALFGFAFFWLIAAFLIWKLPGKSGFNWPLFAVGMLVAIVIGTRWN